MIAATLPLIRKHGIDVSTRQIAEAAGIAQGTIFRVFPDKDSLIQATVDAAFDPASVVAALERIDRCGATERTAHRNRAHRAGVGHHGHQSHDGVARQPPARATSHISRQPRPSEVIGITITRLIEPDRDQLRVPPAQAARLLRLLLFSGSHPGIAEGRLLTPEEIVGVILDGVRVRHVSPVKGHIPC